MHDMEEIKMLMEYLYKKHHTLLLSSKQVALELHKSKEWLYLNRTKGINPHYLIEENNGIRYRVDHVAEYIVYGKNGIIEPNKDDIKKNFIELIYKNYSCQTLTQKQTAEIFGRSIGWLGKLRKDKKGPAYRKNTHTLNGDVRYMGKDIINYIISLPCTQTVSITKELFCH